MLALLPHLVPIENLYTQMYTVSMYIASYVQTVEPSLSQTPWDQRVHISISNYETFS